MCRAEQVPITFNFNPLAALSGNIDGGGGNNTLDYSQVAGPVTVNLQTGAATDIGGTFSNIQNFIGSISLADMLIGPDAIWQITGPNSGSVNSFVFSSFENLTCGAGTNQFIFSPGGSISGKIDAGGGTIALDYSALVGPITVNLATGTAPGVGGIFSNVTSLVGSKSNADVLIGPDADSVWTLTGPNAGNVAGVTFSSFENLTGGKGADRFVLQTGSGITGNVDGGGGNNSLDYSYYVGDLVADLALGISTGVGGNISNIQVVIGSIGNDLVVGDKNANVLLGGTGRSVIIGGGGGDKLTGGKGDNLLISGCTAYDRNLTALWAIMKEWTRTDRSFDQRIDDLNGDDYRRRGYNGRYGLNRETVFEDRAKNVLTGGTALDWIFADLGQDKLFNLHRGDRITNL